MFFGKKSIDKDLLYKTKELAQDFNSIETKSARLTFSRTSSSYRMNLYDKNKLNTFVLELDKYGNLNSYSLRSGTKEIRMSDKKANNILSGNISDMALSNQNILNVKFSEDFFKRQEENMDINLEKFDNSKEYISMSPEIQEKLEGFIADNRIDIDKIRKLKDLDDKNLDFLVDFPITEEDIRKIKEETSPSISL